MNKGGRKRRGMEIPSDFVGRHVSLAARKDVLRKLLDVGLARGIVDNGVVVGALRFGLLEAAEQRRCVFAARG